MKRFGVSVTERIRRVDPLLFFAVTSLTVISILTIIGAVHNFGRSKLVMQAAMSVVGVLLVFVIANMDYKFLIDRAYILMFLATVFFLALTLFIGSSGTNMDTANKSWLALWPGGPTVQPSEFAKITFICTFAKHLELVRGRINKPLVLLGLLGHAGAVVGLILLSGDLGVALVFVGLVAVMLFEARLSLWYFLGILAIVALLFPFLWESLAVYQQERILIGFSPELDPTGYGMQPLMSLEAIGAGGIFGQGMMGGEIYEELAASHTDFIFATVCEKFGFLGGFFVILLLSCVIVRTVMIGMHSCDYVGRLICCGVATVLILQTLENIGMCLGLLPVIGLTLPFVSCGGSSMLALYVLVGLVHSVRAHDKKLYFRREL